MRAVIQRVCSASVSVKDRPVAGIGRGLLVFVGVGSLDGPEDAGRLAEKVAHLRIFEDVHGQMNRSVLETHGEILAVSQFTLYGDCSRGRRPSFSGAMNADEAGILYRAFMEKLRAIGLPVQAGVFQERMLVKIENEGPVTLWIDTRL